MASGWIRNILNYDADLGGILFLCLGVSTGVGITFVSLLPLGPDTPSYQRDVLYMTGKFSLSVITFIIIVQLVRLSMNKVKNHQNQTVFWPMRCNHCAAILSSRISSFSPDVRRLIVPGCILHENPAGRSTRRSTGRQIQVPSTTVQTSGQSDTLQVLESSSNPVDPSAENIQITSRPHSHETSASSVDNDHLSLNTALKEYTRSKRNTSFLKIYGVLLIFTSLCVALDLVSSMACFFKGSDISRSSMIASSIQSVIFITLIPATMLFALNYYDAVFSTTTENIFTMVLFLAGASWISVFKIATPVSELLEAPYSLPEGPCGLNGTLAKIQQKAVLMLTPFNTECAIIAFCILWHMWASFVPRHLLCLTVGQTPEWNIFQSDSFIGLIKKVFASCKACVIHRGIDQNPSVHSSIQDLSKCLRKAWMLSTLFSIVYFLLITCIDLFDPFKEHRQYKVETMWTIDIIFILPFFILHMHQTYVSRNSQETFTSFSHRKVELHDLLLLLCSCGIFCHLIMRLSAGCGVLLSDYPAFKAISVFEIIYSLAITLLIWKTTAFLLQVQRIRMANVCEIKWVLVCLIYVSVSNGTRWLFESITDNRWQILCAFYGETAGNVIGALLEPFVTLYGLHAAMIAYEAYKSILQDASRQYASADQSF